MNLDGQGKDAWRNEYRSLRSACQGSERIRRQKQLSKNLASFLDRIDSLNHVAVFAYWPLKNEADPSLLGSIRPVYYPKIDGFELSFYKPKSLRNMKPGSHGIYEPDALSSELFCEGDGAKTVVVLTPALAVDWQGTRLGMGKGFYDRYFERNPKAIRVGVVFQLQVVSVALPKDGWDKSLDWIVSDEMILRVPKRSA